MIKVFETDKAEPKILSLTAIEKGAVPWVWVIKVFHDVGNVIFTKCAINNF